MHLQVYLVSMPVFWVNSVVDVDPEIQALDYIGWAMWGFGFLAQTVGDLQKLWFRQKSENKLKVAVLACRARSPYDSPSDSPYDSPHA